MEWQSGIQIEMIITSAITIINLIGKIHYKNYENNKKSNELSLSKKYYHFNIYKLDDIYCDEYKCSSHKKNIRILRDNSYHVSLPAAKDLISPHFINYLKFKLTNKIYRIVNFHFH